MSLRAFSSPARGHGARELYGEARKRGQDAGDDVSMMLFEELLADEEGHIDHIETEPALIEKIGNENYGLLQAGEK